MIERLIEFAVRRRAWVILAAALWALLGIWAVLDTPIDAVPDLSENQVIVYANWPGHGPEEVDRHVTYPLSLLFQGLPGVRAVRGSSDVGYSMLHLIFDDSVHFAAARERAQERLAGSPRELPEGVVPRLAADGIPTGQIFWYTVEGAGYDLGELRSLQDWTIAPQLSSVPGVAEVASVGGFVREIHVQLDLTRLQESGLSIDNVRDVIAAARATVGGHVVHKGNAEFVVEVDRRSTSATNDAEPLPLAEIEQLIIPNRTGVAVRLRDVARVISGTGTIRST
jgi:Cu(I)/Ag(I) efflux system membrane protein CusA/SilA